ncbi:MAG: hypothetical protein O2931_07720 [Planctomycetota bacterium]|nr:hypothetical protein [Planctomycetota bacterium]MDA1178668.1 hypothetical protein [Planctomycetota bacterium]
MARQLILDWRADRLVGLITNDNNSGDLYETFVVDGLPSGSSSLASIAAAQEPLAAVVNAKGLRRSRTVILLGREFYELQPMSLPPAPEVEWPDMVAFQSLQHFTTLRDDGVVDFTPLESSSHLGTQVLAAAISKQARDALVTLAGDIGLRLEHICPRPSAAVHAAKAASLTVNPYWLLDIQNEQAEITLVDDDRILLTRSARWDTSELLDGVAALERERLRTRAAAPADRSDVRDIVLCGSEPIRRAYQERFDSLGKERLHIIPNPASAKAGQCDTTLLSAALIGAAYEIVRDRPPLLDFLHSRHRPVPKDAHARTRQIVLGLAASVAAAVALFWWRLGVCDEHNLSLQRDLQSLKKEADGYKKIRSHLGEVERWAKGHANWLERLGQVARALPPADQVLLSKVLATATGEGGVIRLEGRVDKPDTLEIMENNLRGESLHPSSEGRIQLADAKHYVWSFNENVFVNPTPFVADVGSPTPSPRSPAPPSGTKSSAAVEPPAAREATSK